MSRIAIRFCTALLGAALLSGPALAQPRTGRVDVACTPESGQGLKISFTLDYDQHQVLGISNQMTLDTWNDDFIHWQVRATNHRYYFIRRTGELGFFDAAGEGHRYNCRRVAAEERF